MTTEWFRLHRAWVSALLLGCLFLWIEPMVAQTVIGAREASLRKEEEKQEKLLRQKTQWVEDEKTARAAKAAPTAREIHRLLRPADEKVLIRRLEAAAAQARLFNVSHALSEPETWGEETNYPGLTDIVRRTLTLQADAPVDLDPIRFLKALNVLSGRVTLSQLEMTPLKEKPDAFGALNIRLSATFEWLTNAPEEGLKR